MTFKRLTLSFMALFIAVSTHWAAFAELNTVPHVDLDRYLGTWYEIARLPHKYQEGCHDTKATYSLRRDGDIRVQNECIDNKNGKARLAIGRAWVVNKETNAKLKVQFFLNTFRIPFFAGDYWVIDLDTDGYSYSVVSEPKKKLLWILSRTERMPLKTFLKIVKMIESLGYDSSKLIIDDNKFSQTDE
jgi:apolipoprotein D and lipocalin family protein